MASFTIGADVEVFLYKGERPFNLAGKIAGTKHKPTKTDFGVESWDNVSYEFAINYTSDPHVFSSRIQAGKQRAEEVAALFDCMVRIDASAVFKPEELDTKEALTFGCEPDFSAWSLMENVNPMLRAKNLPEGLRSCGGHIHIGCKVDHIQLVRLLDLHLSVPLVRLDKDVRRRGLYGRAGSHRKKPYGVEYRAPSNCWIKDPNYVHWVYFTVADCVRKAEKPDNWVNKEDAKRVIYCINTSNEELALELMREHYIKDPNSASYL